MSQHDFQFFVNLMTFFSQKKSDKIFSFHIYFSRLWKFSKRKKRLSGHVYLNVFNHIVTFLKNKMNFLWLPYPLLKKLVSYLVLWDLDWWQSHLGLGAHLRRWHRKQIVKRWMWIFYNQISKDECEFFTIKFGWIISPCF